MQTDKAEVVAHGRGEKVKIVKFRRRKHYRKQQQLLHPNVQATSVKATNV